MTRRLRVLGLAALLCLAPACAEDGDAAPAPGPRGGGEQPPVPVSVEEAGAPRLDRSFPVLGEVRTRHRAELAVGADGPIVRFEALEGQRVERGALLVQVDDALANAEWTAAEAALDEGTIDLERAEADLARYELVDQGVLAPAELDRVRADARRLHARKRSLEARLAEARARVGRHAARAPFAGVVTRRHADVGDWVTPGRVLVELASTGELDVLVDVAAELAAQLTPGAAVSLRGAGREATGTIAAIVPVLDPETRTARVRISPAPDGGLVPGAPVTVVFETEVALEAGARVPRDAVTAGSQGAQVVRVVDGVAEPVPVRVLAESPEMMLVEGIEPGATVVVRGNERLRPGQKVRIAEAGR